MQNSDKNRFPDLLTLMKSWIPGIKMEGDTSNPNPNHSPNPSSRNFPRDFWMPDQSCRVCYDCDSQFNLINRRHHCRLCGRVFCSKCTSFIPLHPKIELIEGGERIRVCNYCLKQWEEAVKGRNGKNAVPDSPVLSPSVSSASLASSCTGQTSSSLTGGTCSNQNYDSAPGDYMRFDQAAMIPSEIHVVKDVPNVVANNCEHYQFCMNRSDDDDDDSSYSPSDSETLKCRNSADFSNIPNFPNIPNSYSQPDKPPLSISPTQNPNPKPLSPVHSESASSFTFTSDETRSYSGDESTATSSHLYGIERIDENLVDVENNQLLWVPPEAADGEEESEEGEGEDEDGVGPTGDWGYQRSNSFGVGLYRNRERSAEEHKKVMKNVVDGHFKALITQLLQVENISIEGREGRESWLDIITCLAWEAASLLKPDMSKGGGMDPGGYVKVKCIASGCRTDSAVIKGVVCKKNVAHRRMKPEIKKPRILILGGALEYQRVSNLLSSFDTLLQQEMEYLRMAVAKIQAHKPNILLVEKAVSRSAQDLFLDRNISLVLNIKRPLLERISRCTGAQIVPSIDHLSNPKLGNCELFHVEKFLEKHEGGKQVLKTLMFFEDCPKPLGCTILLKGASSDELKRVKHVVQYGVFAAYHLALETSFLADEGATLPELPLKTPLIVSLPEKHSVIERSISLFNPSPTPQPNTNPLKTANSVDSSIFGFLSDSFLSTQATAEKGGNNKMIEKKPDDGRLNVDVSGAIRERFVQNEDDLLPSPSDPQSILVSLSSRCDWKKTVCENPRLLRITYYGSADKPLGRFLREQLFNQSYACHSCDMPSEAHMYCYTHRLGCLTISVRKLPEAYLQGESSGKIWMWHRCLKCPQVKKLPPANKRVVMSDAAWGLSFGKFLELSFSNHASASRVASCGHSLHRDCLRFYGFGRMVACFRYAPIKVHNVYLPPSKLDFAFWHQDWVAKEAREVADFVEQTFKEISNALQKVTDKRLTTGSLDGNGKLLESWRIFTELDMILQSEKELVQRLTKKETKKGEPIIDILEVNKLRRQLIFLSYIWDQRLIFASNTIKEKGESTNNLVNSNIDDVNQENTTMNGFKRVLSDGQFPIITDLSDTLDAKWRGENGKNLTEEVTTQADWYKKEFSMLDDSLIKNLKLASLDVLGEYNPNYLPVFRDLARYNGARLLLPIGFTGTVIPVFDDEPTSIISYVLASQDYHSQLSEQPVKVKEVGSINPSDPFQLTDDFSSENIRISSSGDIRVSFEGNGFLGKVKYSVLCYYAKCFEALRKKCCPSEVDFVRSLSRCKKWGAQGGKSNVFFAKSLDDRFIIKQVTKTELESFVKFAPEYFKYLSESIGTKSPTCLAKILGIYQVSTKHVKGGKESKMDLLVMENLLFRRNVTRLYDLKGSSRSRYNSDQSGNNTVLLDQNLIEMMPTCPIFVGKDAKRILERAIWNDTAFLASIDVMDYSLLVGVDEERHELVLGIIDFVRQYTWDKHLETWAKSSGILGGSKNASPTVISPNLYKKRFRKAMSTYFIVVPDQWRPSGIVPNKSFSELNQDSQGASEET